MSTNKIEWGLTQIHTYTLPGVFFSYFLAGYSTSLNNTCNWYCIQYNAPFSTASGELNAVARFKFKKPTA